MTCWSSSTTSRSPTWCAIGWRPSALVDAHLKGRLSTPAHFILHSWEDVREQLTRGRYFFVDIVKEGIALHQTPEYPFEEPQELPPEVAREEAQRHFNAWLPKIDGLIRAADHARRDNDLNLTAFLLHQATERLYQCVLLTLYLYTPKSHNLQHLHSLCDEIDLRLLEVWPRHDQFSEDCFKLLNRAYVEARYSPDYAITTNELSLISERIAHLREAAEHVCRDYLACPLTSCPHIGFNPKDRWDDEA